jgi:pyruvate dehydrogenase E2 component (dihydrolipoamide acetyltransferase)
MIYTVKMPDIGEGVVEGEVIEWLKKVGQEVKQDEPIVVVMTDKATVELPAPTPGKLVRQYYEPGQMAQRDRALYDLETEEEVKEAPELKVKAEPKKKAEKPSLQGGLAIPAVRKMARSLGIDLTKVAGTGSDERVTLEALQKFITKSPVPLPIEEDDEEIPLVGIRHQMALHMKAAHEAIPHFSYFEQADATRLIQLKDHLKVETTKEGIRMTYMPLFIRALSLTLTQYPQVNSSYDAAQNKLIVHKHHHIGIAFSTPQGLLVPILHDVEKITLPAIIRSFETLKQKVEKNQLQPTDMQGATITISNYGVLGGGGLYATPIIHSPEVAILAVAKIQRQPLVKQAQVVACDLLNLSWSFDHRVIDGELAANFSHHFCTLIQNPAQLL